MLPCSGSPWVSTCLQATKGPQLAESSETRRVRLHSGGHVCAAKVLRRRSFPEVREPWRSFSHRRHLGLTLWEKRPACYAVAGGDEAVTAVMEDEEGMSEEDFLAWLDSLSQPDIK